MATEGGRTIRFRQAKSSDINAIREFFDTVLLKPYPDQFFKALGQGIETGYLEPGTQLMVVVAIDAGHLVGCICVSTMKLMEAREKGKITFDVLDKTSPDSKAAYVMMMGVLDSYRRRGIGKDLVFEGLRRLVENDRTIEASFLHCLAEDEIANAFYEDNGYQLLGKVPSHYEFKTADGKQIKADAHVYVRVFHDGELPQYQLPKGESIVNLKDPELKRVKKAPKWLVDCGLQFLLPLAIVALLFLISYGLVLAGPLRGISRKFIKGGHLEEMEDGEEEMDPLAGDEDL